MLVAPNSMLFFLPLALLAWCGSALAEIKTINIKDRVSYINGIYGTEFDPGEKVEITITVDDSIADFDPRPNYGFYSWEALVLLEVEFKSSGHRFVAQGSSAIFNPIGVYNDIDLGNKKCSDQLAYLAWTPLSGSLGGYPLAAMEVDFQKNTLVTCPTMLINDGLPTDLFSYESGWVLLKVDDGTSDWMEILFEKFPWQMFFPRIQIPGQ